MSATTASIGPRKGAVLRILGSRVDLIDLPTTVDRIEEWVRSGERSCRQVVVTGFHGIWEAHRNPRFHRVLAAADLWVPDGIAPVAVARVKGHRGVSRVPGAELLAEFCRRGNARGYRSYFYGDTDVTLRALEGELARRHPGLQIVGTCSPPFRALTPAEDADHVRRINEAKPDVLWVGLGLPKQDVWIHEHRDRLQVPVAIGVGAAFGFVSGRVKRAPAWMGRWGLEWAYRLAQEPRKCWRRCSVDGPRFCYAVVRELAGKRTAR